jgi:hypothetical protein
MKIYKASDECRFYINSFDSATVYINGGAGCSYIFKRGKLILENYEVNRTLGLFFSICGESFRRVDVRSGDENSSSLINSDFQMLDVPELFVRSMFPDLMTDYSNEVFFSYFGDYPDRRDSNLVIYNFTDKSIIKKSSKSIFSRLINEHVYGYERIEKQFIKRDLKLSTIWAAAIDYSGRVTSMPIKVNKCIVCFFGPESDKSYVENTVSKYSELGGDLIGFNDDNGDVVWQFPIPEAIDDIGLFHDKIFVAVYDHFLIIAPETGEVLAKVATHTSFPVNRVSAAHVFVDDTYIYYTHAEDELLLIYALNNYELRYTVPMPKGYRIKGHQFTDVNTGKHYFTLNNLTQDAADFPSLEIDPMQLDGPVLFEKEPEKTFELIAVADAPSEHEIVIKMQSSSLDDALRFGEIYTRDSASHHGFNHSGRTYGGRQPTPTFNGVIRFVLSGCIEDKAHVLEKLSMMEKRFTHWNEHDINGKHMYACTDKYKAVSLITEYQ